MALESRLTFTNQRLELAEDAFKKAKERAKSTKAKVREVEEAMALAGTWAVEEFRKLMKFQDEVGEASYDAFQKGFVEYKEKVDEAFPDLDLRSIVAKEPKGLEEEEVKAEVAKEVSSVKAKVETE